MANGAGLMIRRMFLWGALSSCAVGLVGTAALAAAAPSPSPSAPPKDVRLIQISGDGLGSTLILASDKDSVAFTSVAAEVSFLASRPPMAATPEAGKAGPKYVVILFTNGSPHEQYDLYPDAVGGPRAFRPAAQPDGRTVAEGWFYGRLSMPSTLRAVGVPVGTPEDGGIGGGLVGGSPTPDADVEAMIGDWRRFMGLNGAVIAVLATGIFAIAFMLRRRV